MDAVRVLIVGTDPLARAGLASTLDGHPAVSVTAQAGPPDEGPAVAAESGIGGGVDAVLWDTGWDGGALEPLASAAAAGVPIVAVVARRQDAAAALAAGARGVLPRDADASALAAALQGVAQGLIVLDPAISAAQPAREADEDWVLDELTPREREVLQLLARGLPNREIARRLGVSEHTAKFHVTAILGKLNAHSRTEAVARAARLGLVVL